MLIAIAAMPGYISTKEAMYFYLSVSMLRLKNCCRRVPMIFFFERLNDSLATDHSILLLIRIEEYLMEYLSLLNMAVRIVQDHCCGVALRWLRLAICECFSETVDSTAAVCDVQGAAKKSSHKIICCFLSNRLEFQCEILVAYM